jgi:hypothetical protein
MMASLCHVIDPFSELTFSPAKWAQAGFDERAGMARDLIRHHLPIGTSRAKVEELLGPPAHVLAANGPRGKSVLGAETYSYYLGSWSMYGMDDAFVYVHFDAAGKVLGAEITGY